MLEGLFLSRRSEDERLIARLVHHLLDVSQFNTHQISEIGHWDMTEGVQVRPVGCVINPTLALFNHSCSPNTIRLVLKSFNL